MTLQKLRDEVDRRLTEFFAPAMVHTTVLAAIDAAIREQEAKKPGAPGGSYEVGSGRDVPKVAEKPLTLREAAERVIADRRENMVEFAGRPIQIGNSALDALEAALREVPAPEAVKVEWPSAADFYVTEGHKYEDPWSAYLDGPFREWIEQRLAAREEK